jgi:hypothetical protein
MDSINRQPTKLTVLEPKGILWPTSTAVGSEAWPVLVLGDRDSEDKIWRTALAQQVISLLKHTEHTKEFQWAVSNLRYYILVGIIRLRWEPTLKLKGMPRHFKKCLPPMAKTGNQLIELIISLHQAQQLPCHPTEYFIQVFLENEALGILATASVELTRTEFLERFRHANQQLYTLESNPFTQPHTRHLFDQVLALAEQNEPFRGKFMAFVKARRQISAMARKELDLVAQTPSGDGQKKRQGKRKKHQETKSQT